MTQDEIIAMANEAGLNSYRIPPSQAVAVWGRFAARVAAKEREACADICDQFAARTTEAQQGPSDSLSNVMLRQVAVLGHSECAHAIRARGEKEGA
jgi:hypothetical protein